MLEDNPYEALMVACPLPPREEWDDVMHARMALLGARGLSPRFFLPVGGLGQDVSKCALIEILRVPQTNTARSDWVSRR